MNPFGFFANPVLLVLSTLFVQAGHALAGLLLGRDVHRTTMLPVNTDFGVTTLVPIEGSMSLPQIRDEIVFLMAGRAAEELLRGDTSLSVYSSPCLLKASNSARNLIMNFGYSDKVLLLLLWFFSVFPPHFLKNTNST